MDSLVLLLGLSLLILPGYICLLPFQPQLKLNGLEHLCAASGLTLLLLPLLLYFTTSLYLTLGEKSMGGLIFLCSLIFLRDIFNRLRHWYHHSPRAIPLSYPLLGLIFALALYPRLNMVENINYPLWTDSYHHTIISDLIATHGTIPQGYAPYAPITDFTYHFGFHTLVAGLHWLTHLPIPQAVVIMGQLLNALVVPTTYFLSWQLWRKQTAALMAALAVGLLFHVPTLFINWGRYPQLDGQIALPVLMALTLRNLERPIYARRLWFLIGLGLAGLFLVHVRVFLFYLIFMGWVWLIEGWRYRQDLPRLKSLGLGIAIILSTMLAINSLWLWQFIRGFGTKVVTTVAAGYNPAHQAAYFSLTPDQIFAYGVSEGWLVAAALAALWGLWHKDQATWWVLLWFSTMLGIANLYMVGLVPLFSNVIVIIYLYLPAALLVGYGTARLELIIKPYLTPLLRIGLAIGCIFAIGLYQSPFLQALISLDSMILRPADLQAMAWIKTHVPSNALFFIQGQFWTPQLVHGVDGGYWLPYVTGHETTIPPEFYGSDGTSDYINFINQRAIDLSTTDPLAFWQALKRYGITHIYLGQRRHELDPALFLAHPNQFKTVYHQDEVWVFEIVQP